MPARLYTEIDPSAPGRTVAAFETGDAGYQFVVDHTWISRLGISFHLGVDGISLFLIVLTGIIFPIAILGAKIDHDQKAYYGWLMVLMAGSMGVFSALDLVLFFAFFEIVLVPMYFLIGLWGHGQRIYAATKFFLYTMFGSAFMLVGIVALAVLNQRAVGGQITFDLVEIAQNQAISVCSGVRVRLLAEPRDFTSSYCAAHSAEDNAGGGAGRN